MFAGDKIQDSIIDIGDRVSILEREVSLDAGGGVSEELNGPVHLQVKNTSGGALTKGSPVYATGSVGASGAVEVSPSDADSSSTMPALGLLNQDLSNGQVGDATVLGVIREVDTSAYTINDELYVSTTAGALTNVRPTGATDLVQKIGRVVRVHATTGEILVLGAGRTNDVPNGTLANDISGNAATATALETARTIGGVSFDGTANINLPGVNTAGNQDTSGNAATATLAADSSLLGGLGLKSSSGTPSGSQVIRSHTNGYTYLGWINTPSGATTSTIDRIYASNDNFVRYVTPATFRSQVTDPHYLLNTTDTLTGKLTITGDMVADDVQATTGVFYGGGSDTAQPNEYMQFSESGNWWRVVNDGGEDFRVTSSGYAQTQGRRYYFGIGSNDYINFDETNNEYEFVSDGTQRVRVSNAVLLDVSGQTYWSLSPPTGTGNDAEWTAAFGYYYLRRNSSVAADKVNIQTDLGGHLTADMIDSVVPKMWARAETPDYPEIGPIADDMDLISPFLVTRGTDANGDVFMNGIDRNAYLALLVLAVKDLRGRVAALEA